MILNVFWGLIIKKNRFGAVFSDKICRESGIDICFFWSTENRELEINLLGFVGIITGEIHVKNWKD